MSDVWITIIALTVTTAMIRASGPVLLGGRELSPLVIRMIALLAPALLAALIVIGTFTDADSDLELDARAAGLATAGAILAWRRTAMLGAVAAAAVAAALVRAVFG
jgi:branched-subunit amino acid transport protein